MPEINLARSDMEPTDAQLQSLVHLVAVDVKARAEVARKKLHEAVAVEIKQAKAAYELSSRQNHARMAV